MGAIIPGVNFFGGNYRPWKLSGRGQSSRGNCLGGSFLGDQVSSDAIALESFKIISAEHRGQYKVGSSK